MSAENPSEIPSGSELVSGSQDDTITGAVKKIQTLVLDAGPLITQSASSLQQHANNFYTTPGVYSELKDETVRQQLLIWNDTLKIRHPKEASIKRVVDFAKLTGDYAVLSTNDLHIIALAYELECELNGGDWRLRKFPGEKLNFRKSDKILSQSAEKAEPEIPAETSETTKEGVDTVKAKKPRRRGGKKQRAKREAQLQNELEQEAEDDEQQQAAVADSVQELKIEDKSSQKSEPEVSENESIVESYDSDDDDGDWITPDNLQEEMLKDGNEQLSERLSTKTSVNGGPLIKVAISTGDFACQNVTMQLGLNLMNSMSGRQIKRVRNYMYRCHACFRLTPIPKNGQPKHFCPKCGGATLLRCAVSVDNITGRITPHLKANFQWIKRGEKFTLPSPLSKNQTKRQGNGGYQHNKQNRHKDLQNPLLLREDQKEYQQALKDDEWQRRKNDKMLQEWIGGGSADNYVSPFIENVRQSGVRVGKGRFANSSKGKK